MTTKVIGIISYLPDAAQIRQHRYKKLLALINSCNTLFNIPIIIIAQNWKEECLQDTHVTIYNYNKLGIVGARKELRNIFLKSNYDYLIMLDDDCELIGQPILGQEYLRQIDMHPDGYGIFHSNLLKLFAISRYIFSQINYRDIDPEKGEGFEDSIFMFDLEESFSTYKFNFIHHKNFNEISDSTGDIYSTWSRGIDNEEILRQTRRITNGKTK